MEQVLRSPDWYLDGKAPGWLWLMSGQNARYVVDKAVFVRKLAYHGSAEHISGAQKSEKAITRDSASLSLKFLLLKAVPLAKSTINLSSQFSVFYPALNS